jgi:hypothetical protein
MQLVERHLVRKDHPHYASIDAAAFASKNLYNQANYQIRQAFIHEGTYLPYAEIFHRIKQMDCYKALPAKVANSILILLHHNWVAFFETLKAYQADPSRSTGRPKLPTYSGLGEGAQPPHLRHASALKARLQANGEAGAIGLTHRDRHLHHRVAAGGPGAHRAAAGGVYHRSGVRPAGRAGRGGPTAGFGA